MGGAASSNKLPFGAKTPAQAVVEHYKARAAGKVFLVTVRTRCSGRSPRGSRALRSCVSNASTRVRRPPLRRLRASSCRE